MNYWPLNFFLTFLSNYESLTFCLMIFSAAEEEEQWDGEWGGEEDGKCNMEGQHNCNHGYHKYINSSNE